MAHPHPTHPGARSQRGATLVLFALMLTMVLSFAALSVDTARLLVVKSELRNAADAGALAGATGLMSGTTSIDWEAARSRTLAAVRLNRADGSLLQAADVRSGFWDLDTTTYNPLASFVEVTTKPVSGRWVPALKVTVARDSTASGTTNGGPLSLFLAPVMGLLTSPARATVIAMQSAVGTAYQGSLFPTAINLCMFQQYWNTATNQPIPVSPTSPFYNPADPYELGIGTSKQYGTCNSGQWTTFNTTDSSTGAVQGLLTGGNPVDLHIGDLTYINTGVKNTLYSDVVVNKTYLLPVVDNVGAGFQKIVAFAPFHVTRSVGGSTKVIYGRFVSLAEFPGKTGPGGDTYYGTAAPPALVQ